MLYAHSNSDDHTQWQPLHEHLGNVAELCATFAKSFGYEQWGRVLGLLHDVGKACNRFQKERLHGKVASVDHAAFGARRALELYGGRGDRGDSTGIQAYMGELMAYAILGHHRGMKDSLDVEERIKRLDRSPVPGRPVDDYSPYQDMLEEFPIAAPPDRSDLEPTMLSRIMQSSTNKGPDGVLQQRLSFSAQALTRMLFSCLVDADWLDTEQFLRPDHAGLRQHSYDSIPTLLDRLENRLEDLASEAKEMPVNIARGAVLTDCKKGAASKPGLFTLTVPTGGGKTLSSMEFALRHAVMNGLERIIYAIPFTSIVEQSAAVFREIFGMENVLEHHSNYDFEAAAEEGREYERLAVQNWDAPIVVTTNVQLLESLFSNKPGKCRKLHNIANSVIVLDEAQTIPIELIRPTLAMLEELTLDFGVSVVLCTATQPAVQNEWPFGTKPSELCGSHEELFSKAFNGRVRYQVVGEIPEDELVGKLFKEHQALCVVGKKAEARVLYNDVVACARECGLLDGARDSMDAGFFHLSAHMVPMHRSQMIARVKDRLSEGERCVVISTQLIEAGVDVDFPIVWREMAGLDSVVQAAGRCNRNGRRTDELGNKIPGDVFVFEFAETEGAFKRPSDMNWLGKARSIAREVVRDNDGSIDVGSVDRYFERCYQSTGLDAKSLYRGMSTRSHLQPSSAGPLKRYAGYDFECYANTYTIIEDSGDPIFVPWGEEGRKLLNRLRFLAATHDEASFMHALQPYSVNVYKNLKDSLMREGLIDQCGLANVLCMEDDCRTIYSEETGLLPPDEGVLNTMIL